MQTSFDKNTLEKLRELKERIEQSSSIAVLTGAGISVPSGIPDFRSAKGLYSTKYGAYSAEEIISHDFFLSHVEQFYEFYKDKMVWQGARPNAMHNLLAKLEKCGKISVIVTQNIDGLHTMAGNKKVMELHGSIERNRCERCHKFFNLDYIMCGGTVPHCDECGGVIKPEVVLYGESLDDRVLRESINAIRRADMLIVIGTSLVVYPAAGLVEYFEGDSVCVINKSQTYFDSSADILIMEDCALVAKWLDDNLVL